MFVDSTGLYKVEIVNQYGCVARDSMNLTVIPSVTTNFSHIPAVEVGDPVAFTDNSSPNPANWTWNFGDNSPNVTVQNPVHVYNTAGIYSVFLISRIGICSDTATSSIEVLNDCNIFPLSANFTSNVDTVFLQGQGAAIFTNTSANANSYLWNFGDGNTSTLVSPVHIYSDSGTYTIELTAINYNCTTSTTNTIVVISVNVSDKLESENVDVNLFPNPNDGQFNLKTNGLINQQYFLRIFDGSGRNVYQESVNFNQINQKQIILNNLSSGLYFIQIMSENNDFIYNNKFIINK